MKFQLLFLSLILILIQSEQNYYELLGVDKKVTKADLKKAFKELAKKYHPDKIDPKNKDDAEKNFAEIANAYETLKDEKLKQQYDHELKYGKASSQQQRYQKHSNFGGFQDFSQYYNSFFKNAKMNSDGYMEFEYDPNDILFAQQFGNFGGFGFQGAGGNFGSGGTFGSGGNFGAGAGANFGFEDLGNTFFFMEDIEDPYGGGMEDQYYDENEIKGHKMGGGQCGGRNSQRMGGQQYGQRQGGQQYGQCGGQKQQAHQHGQYGGQQKQQQGGHGQCGGGGHGGGHTGHSKYAGYGSNGYEEQKAKMNNSSNAHQRTSQQQKGTKNGR